MKNVLAKITALGLEKDKLPKVLLQRVNACENLEAEIIEAKEEQAQEPTPEGPDQIAELEEYYQEYEESTIDSLEAFKVKEQKKNQPVDPPTPTPTPATPAPVDPPTSDPKKKESNKGVFMVLGGLLLAGLTLGAYKAYND